MFRHEVYLVGPRYKHYAAHSGYESISRYCGMQLKSPVKYRFLSGRLGKYRLIGDLGWRIDEAVTALARRRLYSLGILLIEAAAGLHMLTHRKSLYHVFYGETDVWLLRYVKRLTGNRLVATFHDPRSRLEWLGADKTARDLDAVILVSESQREYFAEFLSPERIFVVPHGVDTDFFQPSDKLSNEPVCVTVGNTLRDFETLKSAIDLILESDPGVRFIAVGALRPGGNKSVLRSERVEFLDNLNDEELLGVYQNSRTAIFSFQNATANNAVLEAMACGLPIVATDVGGVREYVGNEASILCKPQNAKALADGVLRILNDSSLATRMSQKSRARALQFDYRVVAKHMRKVYSEILHK
jgi:glycosyltransferase involved in cell wall biosynthesis